MIFTITGPSGSGKSSLLRELLKRYPDEIRPIISITTRKKRPKEIDGTDYYFVEKQDFDARKMAEHVVFGGEDYGISKDEINKYLKDEDNHIYIAIVDRAGAKKLKEKFGAKHFVRNVYIKTDPRKAFLHLCKRFGKENAIERMKIDQKAGLFAKEGYDCMLTNDSTLRFFAYNFMNYVIAMKLEKELKEKEAAA